LGNALKEVKQLSGLHYGPIAKKLEIIKGAGIRSNHTSIGMKYSETEKLYDTKIIQNLVLLVNLNTGINTE